ncbi:MAG TPA: pyrroline-5-carboxylate reductase [Tepidisphaeraceae bacterium]|nr:pyrroline-5-carboxylate reductase [Tepidisphaeraceae bacterium]
MTYELGILGAGNMAEAIVRGVLRANRLKPEQIIAADVAPARRQLFAEQLKIKAVEDNAEVARQSRVILLSVKPQQSQAALAGIGGVLSPDALVISIMAGVSTRFIETALGGGKRWRVIRTMPNTPMLVGQGVVGVAPGQHATAADVAHAHHLFEAAADVVDVTEDKIDAVTAVSGSGPAYVFFLVEQMIAAGMELGLTDAQARQLATKTALGAATMLSTSNDSPAELRRKVTSPGGTTQAAITHMESQGFAQMVCDAIKAAEKRSKELGT